MANVRAEELTINAPCDTLVRAEPIRVPIGLQLATPRNVRRITASFRAAEETKATYTTTQVGAKGQVTTQVHTAIEHTNIVQQQWLLEGRENSGCIGTITDSLATLLGGGRHQRMAPGERTYEVELVIPADAPPTHTGKVSRVFYELTARVDIAMGRDLHALHAFCVKPMPEDLAEHDLSQSLPAVVRYPDDAGRGLWSSLVEPDVRMQLSLDTGLARRGETINGNFLVETPKPLDVRQVRVKLVGHEVSKAQSHHDSSGHQGQPITIDAPRVIAPSWSTSFTLPIEPQGPVTATGTLFSLNWFVEVALDVPWAKDPTIRVPITLVSG